MKLYNTLSRKIETLVPLDDNEVKIYTCGLTVYSHPHIGNWLGYIYWDVLVRTLQASGYKVNRVQNITDVGHLTSDEDAGEDKMLVSALKEGKTAWEVADKYIKVADHEGYELLQLIRPDKLARATNYIDQQIEFIKTLEEKGFTYKVKDGVYFDTSKLSDYGKLARLDIEGLRFGARVADSGKKNPTDFALWKFSPEGQKRDMQWQSPWGTGFPGWHLECSVIARELLGDQIDIHCGGIDHIPVHHTNEIAQTESVTGKPFAAIWMHNNHIKVNGTKMSKSLGNIYSLNDITKKGFDLRAFKLLVLSKNYQTEGNFTWEILESAQNKLNSWKQAVDLIWQKNRVSEAPKHVHFKPDNIIEVLENNLDTPKAIALIDQMLDSSVPTNSCTECIKRVATALDSLLGIDLLQTSVDITESQKNMIAKREQVRKQEDWEKSDEIRKMLEVQGIGIRDNKQGTIWHRM